MLSAKSAEGGVCYTGPRWRRSVAMRMFAQSYRIFEPTSVIRNIEALAAIETLKPEQFVAFHRVVHSLDVPVVDAFRITTCFENLFKARLLLKGFVIHRIDPHFAPTLALAKQQKKRPIRISDLKQAEGLIGKRNIDYQFLSLNEQTLKWSTLVRESRYRSAIGLPDELYESLADYSAKRNSLHFLALDSSQHSSEVVRDLRYIRRSFNRWLVRPHNRLVTSLGFSETLHKAEI